MNYTLALLCLVTVVPTALGLIQPAQDAHENFATNFYRVYNYQAKSEGENVVTSPAAIQKMLAVVYGGAEYTLADEMLWDLRLKHIDLKRLALEAHEEGIKDIGFSMHLKARQLKELKEPIPREDVFDYFQNDFNELGDVIETDNYIVAPKNLTFDPDFTEFAQNYFSVKLLNEGSDDVVKVEQQFGVDLSESATVELLSEVYLNSSFEQSFQEQDNTLRAHGKFRIGKMDAAAHSTFEAEVLELPLKTGTHLSMMIFLPQTEGYFQFLLLQVMGRTLKDFNAISKTLTEQTVEVKLPKIDLEMKTNLASYFLEVATKGVRKLFAENVKLDSMFEKLPENGVKVGSFWLKSGVHIAGESDSTTEKPENANETDAHEPTEVFDATNKSFFFVIKSEKVVYFMGHLAKHESATE